MESRSLEPNTNSRTQSLLEQRKSARNAQLKSQMKGKISSKMIAQDKVKKVRPTTPKRSSPRFALKKPSVIPISSSTSTLPKKPRKVPDFDKIFEQQFKKMESVADHAKKLQQRKEEVQQTTTEPLNTVLQPKVEAKAVVQPKVQTRTVLQPKVENRTVLQPKVETRKRAATVSSVIPTKIVGKRKVEDSKENVPPVNTAKKLKS